jgi:plastocyanin
MRTLLTSLALVPAAIGLVACGGGGDKGGGGDVPAVTVSRGQPVHVRGFEYRFEPGDVVVQGGGGRVKIEFENAGTLAHNLRIEQGGQDLGGTPTFTRGQTKSATVDLRPGRYEMICTVGNHAAEGMTGTITVK